MEGNELDKQARSEFRELEEKLKGLTFGLARDVNYTSVVDKHKWVRRDGDRKIRGFVMDYKSLRVTVEDDDGMAVLNRVVDIYGKDNAFIKEYYVKESEEELN